MLISQILVRTGHSWMLILCEYFWWKKSWNHESWKNNITDSNENILQILTPAHGFISTKWTASLELTFWRLQRLFNTLLGLEYKNTDMLNLMTLTFEYFHVTTLLKNLLMNQLLYSRTFVTSITESIKRVCSWSAHYFTKQSGSWYPPGEDSIHFDELKPYLPKKVTPIRRKYGEGIGQLATVRQWHTAQYVRKLRRQKWKHCYITYIWRM